MNGNKDFSKWLKEREEGPGNADHEAFSFFTQVSSIQLGVSRQMSELSGALPDANALTGAEFRDRVSKSVYLLHSLSESRRLFYDLRSLLCL